MTKPPTACLPIGAIHHGDCRELLKKIEPESVALSVWSPPYSEEKDYEKGVSCEEWQSLLAEVIALHWDALKPGAFLAINIADILCFKDPAMPRIMAENVSRRKVALTREDVLVAMKANPGCNRYQIAKILNCSEQTVDRRLKGNNIRGGKYQPQTRTKLVGGFLEEMGSAAGLFLYDRRVWVKDPAWENSRWHTISYRSVDEFEYIYIFWKPGITKVDRSRLTQDEWIRWGSRGVWSIPSVRANNDHEAKFPLELPRRLIRLFTDPGDVVLDCFVGSGTTAVAAIKEERRYIGVDKEKKYVALARQACEHEVRQSSDEVQIPLFAPSKPTAPKGSRNKRKRKQGVA